MDAEGCVEGKSQNELHSEAVPQVTLAGELSTQSLVHRLGRLELLDSVSYPGDSVHNNLHGAAGSDLL